MADPRTWREVARVRKLAGERYGDHFQPTGGLAPLRALWKVLAAQKIVRFGNSYMVNSFIPPFPSRAFETLLFRNLQGVAYGEPSKLVLPPLSTHIAVTNRCTLHCWHCSRAKRPDQQEVTTERWLQVISELQAWGVCIIAFTGGEPLLHPDLERMIAAVDARSTSYIFTSGVGLDADRAQRLKKAGLFGVVVSVDHYDETEHDRLRGRPGVHAQALRALTEARRAGMYAVLQTVVTRPLLRDGGLQRIFRLAQRLHVPEVRILPPIPTGELLYPPADILLTTEERQQIIELDKRANDWLGYPKIASFIRAESSEMFGCGAGSQHSYIDAAGNVYPCDFVPLSFGNITERSFREIWLEVSAAIGGTRNRCFMLDHGEAIRQVANGQLPLPIETSHQICREGGDSSVPVYYSDWQKLWQ